MKKNAAAARGAIEPIISVHRDDLINPLCVWPEIGLSQNGFQNLIKRQSNWLEIGGLFFFFATSAHNYRPSYWIKSCIRVHRRIISFINEISVKQYSIKNDRYLTLRDLLIITARTFSKETVTTEKQKNYL